MHRHSRGRWLVLAAALTLAIAPALVHADHSWGNYHWARSSNPFTLELGDNVDASWDAYLQEASDDWSASSVLNTVVAAGQAKGGNCRPGRGGGRAEVCNRSYGNNGWLGLAQIWVSGDHITQATAKMNDTYFNTPTYDTPAWRRLVMCQEVAHDFGLDHQDEDFDNGNLGTCMDYTSNPAGPPSNEHPNAHDYQQLEAIYAHLDGNLTASGATRGRGRGNGLRMPPAMTDIDFAGPGQWGKLVAMSRDGGQAVYELDFGRGHKLLTHVTWTLETAEQMKPLARRLLGGPRQR